MRCVHLLTCTSLTLQAGGDVDAAASEDADDDGTRKPAGERKSVEEMERDIMDKYAKVQADREAKAKLKADKSKRGAAKTGAAKSGKTAALKRPAAADIVSWDGKGKTGKPPCPAVGDPPLDYKSARIYVSASKRSFRVIRTRFDYDTERCIRWKKDTPEKAWKEALAVVDAWKPKKSKC